MNSRKYSSRSKKQEGFEAQADKILRRLNASETATIRAAEKVCGKNQKVACRQI